MARTLPHFVAKYMMLHSTSGSASGSASGHGARSSRRWGSQPHQPPTSPSPHCIKTYLERLLEDAMQVNYSDNLKAKPSQDEVFKVIWNWDASSHFMHFAHWHFIHCIHLNCLLLNSTICYRNQDKRCSYMDKTCPMSYVAVRPA